MNYKRVEPRISFRLRVGLRSGGVAFGTLFAVWGTVFTLLQASGYTFKLRYIVAVLLISIIVSGAYGIKKARVEHLPDSVIIADDRDNGYVLAYETKPICSHFNRETVKYFRHADCVDDVVVEGWRLRNKQAFIYLRNGRGEPCAALCVFSLRPSFMEQFIKGRVAEPDVEPEDVLSLADSKKSRTLYLAAIIVKDPNTSLGHRRACVMVWAVIQYLKRVFGTRKARTIYAVPVNKSSENLLKGLGFRLCSFAATRKDRHDLYCFEMTAATIAASLKRVGDYSNCCSINLSLPETGAEQTSTATGSSY
jgi:hypothetical protein